MVKKALPLALILTAVLIGLCWVTAKTSTVPCKIDGSACVQRKECAFKCKPCQGNEDKCCCRHADVCKCVDPTGARCCPE